MKTNLFTLFVLMHLNMVAQNPAILQIGNTDKVDALLANGGKIWVSSGSTIITIDTQSLSQKIFTSSKTCVHPSSSIKKFLKAVDGNTIVLTEGWMTKFSDGFCVNPSGTTEMLNSVSMVAELSNGDWVCKLTSNYNQMILYQNFEKKYFTKLFNKNTSSIIQVERDSRDMAWVVFKDKIYTYNSQREWDSINNPNLQNFSFINVNTSRTPVAVLLDNTTSNSLIAKLNTQGLWNIIQTDSTQLSKPVFKEVLEDLNGNILVSFTDSAGEGIAVVDTNNSFSVYRNSLGNFPLTEIRKFIVDDKNFIWACGKDSANTDKGVWLQTATGWQHVSTTSTCLANESVVGVKSFLDSSRVHVAMETQLLITDLNLNCINTIPYSYSGISNINEFLGFDNAGLPWFAHNSQSFSCVNAVTGEVLNVKNYVPNATKINAINFIDDSIRVLTTVVSSMALVIKLGFNSVKIDTVFGFGLYQGTLIDGRKSIWARWSNSLTCLHHSGKKFIYNRNDIQSASIAKNGELWFRVRENSSLAKFNDTIVKFFPVGYNACWDLKVNAWDSSSLFLHGINDGNALQYATLPASPRFIQYQGSLAQYVSQLEKGDFLSKQKLLVAAKKAGLLVIDGWGESYCNGSWIRGDVFEDANNNGVRDSLEPLIPFVNYKVNGTSLYTDARLSIHTNIKPGNATLEVSQNAHYAFAPDSQVVVMPLQQCNNVEANDIAGRPINQVRNMKAIIFSKDVFVPGNSGTYEVVVENKGEIAQNTVVRVDLDEKLNYTGEFTNSASPLNPHKGYSNGSFYVEIAGLQPGERRNFSIAFNIKSNVSVGAVIKSSVSVFPIETDKDVSDNYFETTDEVFGDPQLVSKSLIQGYKSGAYFLNDSTYVYVVRFKNFSPNTTNSFKVVDKLDTAFDISSLKLIAATTKSPQIVVNGNEVAFWFNHLYLDPSSNSFDSRGFVAFEISLKSSCLKPVIRNEASVDYAPFGVHAKVTNTTEIQLCSISSVENINVKPTVIFPNPSSNTVTISSSGKLMQSLVVYDAKGLQLLKADNIKDGYNFNVSSWTAGLYFVEVISDNGNKAALKLIVNQ